MYNLDNCINDLVSFYETGYDKFIVEPICHNFILKSELIGIVLRKIISNNLHDKKIKIITNFLVNTSYRSNEINYIHRIEDAINERIVYEDYNIEKYLNNNYYYSIRNRFTYIKSELSRFNSFSCNQDNFDNYISVIKIIQRMQTNENINEKLSKPFDNNIDNSGDILIDIKNNILNDFEKIRFYI